MKLGDIHLADILANDPEVELIEDERETLGYVSVECPFDDGTDDHLLYVYNPDPDKGLEAAIFCLSPVCSKVTTEQFIELMGNIPKSLN
jgi:hypothetical protein